MKCLFILGRNPELSILELKSVFEDFKFQRKENAVLAEVPMLEKNLIEKLGGTIAIGEVLSCGENFESLDNKMLYNGTKNHMNYIIWNFTNETFYTKVKNYLKKRFREERLRATEKTISGEMELQSGEKVKYVPNRKLIDEQFFVFGECFGRIIYTCDYEEIEKRDMSKPIRRERLAISPRLAKIMINLSRVKKEETLLDPFCGVGVILQEALIQDINVVGVDKDIEAIHAAARNLRHLKVDRERFLLIASDSSKVKIDPVNVIVTEPYLGETLKKTQLHEKAKNTLRKYEGMMISVLNNLKKDVSGDVVFTGPYIKVSGKKRIGCNIDKITSYTGFKLEEGPIPEFRKNQIVGREIFVLRR